MGVVPITFDTYASLRDIITDGVDGEIIAEGDVDGYVRCVLNLMQDDVTRRRMAKAGYCIIATFFAGKDCRDVENTMTI